jgi:hypothetical protein
MPDAHDHVILLRAHRLTPSLTVALSRYAAIDGHDVVVLYDNDRGDFAPFGLSALLMTSEDFRQTDLPYTKGNQHFGLWKNGDYALYHAAAHLPKPYKFYWLIEYDVYINYADLNAFFSIFHHRTEDFIAPYFGPKPAAWMWSSQMRWLSEHVYGCFFPLLRISAPALHHCHMARLYYGCKLKELGLRGSSWPHCEAFVPTQLAKSGFSARDINEYGHVFCDTSWFHARTAEALRLDSLIFTKPDQRLYHPVYPVDSLP